MNSKKSFYEYGGILWETTGCILSFPFVLTGMLFLFLATCLTECFGIREKINKIWKVL